MLRHVCLSPPWVSGARSEPSKAIEARHFPTRFVAHRPWPAFAPRQTHTRHTVSRRTVQVRSAWLGRRHSFRISMQSCIPSDETSSFSTLDIRLPFFDSEQSILAFAFTNTVYLLFANSAAHRCPRWRGGRDKPLRRLFMWLPRTRLRVACFGGAVLRGGDCAPSPRPS